MAGHLTASLNFILITWITILHSVDGRHHLACLAPPVPPPTLRLSCPESRIIHVTMARLGRSNYGVCVPTVRDCFRQVPTPTHCCGRRICDVTIRSNITHFVTEICGAPAHYFQIIYDCKERDAIQCKQKKTTSGIKKASPNRGSESPNAGEIGHGVTRRPSTSLSRTVSSEKEHLPNTGVSTNNDQSENGDTPDRQWSFDFKRINTRGRHIPIQSSATGHRGHKSRVKDDQRTTLAPVIPQPGDSGDPPYPRMMTTERTTEPIMMWGSLLSRRGLNVSELMRRLGGGPPAVPHAALQELELPAVPRPGQTVMSEHNYHPIMRHLRPLPPDVPGHPPWVAQPPTADRTHLEHRDSGDFQKKLPPPAKHDVESLGRPGVTSKPTEISLRVPAVVHKSANRTSIKPQYEATTRHAASIPHKEQPTEQKTTSEPPATDTTKFYIANETSSTQNVTPSQKATLSTKNMDVHNGTGKPRKMSTTSSTTMSSSTTGRSSVRMDTSSVTPTTANAMSNATSEPKNITKQNTGNIAFSGSEEEEEIQSESSRNITLGTVPSESPNVMTSVPGEDEYDRQATAQTLEEQQAAEREWLQHQESTSITVRHQGSKPTTTTQKQNDSIEFEWHTNVETGVSPEVNVTVFTSITARPPSITTIPSIVKTEITTEKFNDFTQLSDSNGDSSYPVPGIEPFGTYRDYSEDTDTDDGDLQTGPFANNEYPGPPPRRSTPSVKDYDVLDVAPTIDDDSYDFEQVPGGPLLDREEQEEDYSFATDGPHGDKGYDAPDDDWSFSDTEFDPSIYEYDDQEEHSSTSGVSNGTETEVRVLTTTELDMDQFERSATTPRPGSDDKSEKITTNLQGAALLGVAVGEGIMFIVLVVSLALYMKRRPAKRRSIAPSGSPLYPEYHMEEEDSRTGSTVSLQRHKDAPGYKPKHQGRGVQNRLSRSPPRPAPRRTYITNAVLARQPMLDFGRDNLIDADILEPDILNNVNNENIIGPAKPARKFFYEEACTAFNIPPKDPAGNPTGFKTFKNVVDELSQTITKCNSLDYSGNPLPGIQSEFKPPENRTRRPSESHYASSSPYPGVIETATIDPRLREYAVDELQRIDDQISYLFNGNSGGRKHRSTPPPDYMQAFE